MNIEDLPLEVELDYSSLNADVLEYYDLEEAIKQYLQEIYGYSVSDFRYYWYDVSTILVHDIKWSVKESLDDDTVEETDEYKIVKSIQHNFRTVKGVARKGKDKIIYQVYFRTEDLNPATNRWQKTGWTNSTSEFDTVEDAREFVKKYGKTLKSEVDENLKESIINDFWHLRDLKEPKYGTGNLVIDGDKIRPLTKDELKFKFAVSIEHADKGDFKTKKELIDFANKTNAEKIMFFFMPGDNYSGEYSLLYSDENKVIDIWKKYDQDAYAKYDSNGVYHEITKLGKTKVGQIFKLLGDIIYCDINEEGMFEDNEELLKEFTDNGFKLKGTELIIPADTILKYNISLSIDNYIVVKYDYSFDVGEWSDEALNTSVEIINDESLKESLNEEWQYCNCKDLDEVAKLSDYCAKNNCKITAKTSTNDGYKCRIEGPFDDVHKVSDKWSIFKWRGTPLEDSLEEDIEKHDTLNDKIFDVETEEMLPEVREKLLEIVDYFVDSVHEDELDLEVKDIVLIGSNANYNYTKDSDLDIHIIASSKPDCNKKHLNQIYQAYKSMFNKNYDIYIHGYPAEVYVEMDEVNARSGGIYSIQDNKWLKQPKQFEIPDIDYDALYKEVDKWEERYFELVNYLDEYENASEEVDKYIDDIYEVRKDSIAKDGEFSIGNLTFKEIRNRGYLDNLKQLKTELASKEMSLESIDK